MQSNKAGLKLIEYNSKEAILTVKDLTMEDQIEHNISHDLESEQDWSGVHKDKSPEEEDPDAMLAWALQEQEFQGSDLTQEEMILELFH